MDNWYALYLRMLEELDLLTGIETGQPKPYNFLMTRQWMMIIPRSMGRFEGISVNALGFAGLLLVKDHKRLGQLEKLGPSKLLNTVSAPA